MLTLLDLFVLNIVVLVLWKLFRKHIEGTAAELLLVVVLLGAGIGGVVFPAMIRATVEQEAKPAEQSATFAAAR